jgi:hypothetical protein
MTEWVCDFCSAVNPIYSYDCADFVTMETPLTTSQGAWLACKECAALIDAGAQQPLVNRCWMIHKTMYPFLNEQSQNDMTESFRRFFTSRKGRKSIMQ